MSDCTEKIRLLRKFGLHASADALAYGNGLTCRTCVHLDSDARSDPCATCRGFERWEARSTDGAQACRKCGQTDQGQTGEYACSECGLPTVWDAPAPGVAPSHQSKEKS